MDPINPEWTVERLADVFASWSEPYSSRLTLYVFGSRARGDNTSPQADVDIVFEFLDYGDDITDWYESQDSDGFQDINKLLPGPIDAWTAGWPISQAVIALSKQATVHRDRNVILVSTPKKVRPGSGKTAMA